MDTGLPIKKSCCRKLFGCSLTLPGSGIYFVDLGMGAKVIIAGGRDFDNEGLMNDQSYYFMRNLEVEEIITGGQKTWNRDKRKYIGADYQAKLLAEKKGIPHREFQADWDRYGKRAGFIRNTEMGEVGTHLLAFWDGKSRGTKMMIDIARKKGIPVEIISY